MSTDLNDVPYEKVGVIGVDAGLCWIGDPCYFLPDNREIDGRKLKPSPEFDKSWCEFVDQLHEDNDEVRQLNYKKGHAGLGVVTQTGLGDGSYDVFAKFVDVPGWGRRVAEIKVVFINQEELDDCEE